MTRITQQTGASLHIKDMPAAMQWDAIEKCMLELQKGICDGGRQTGMEPDLRTLRMESSLDEHLNMIVFRASCETIDPVRSPAEVLAEALADQQRKSGRRYT